MYVNLAQDQGLNLLNLLGAQADSAAGSDTATASLMALLKRGLQTETSILNKLPTLVSGNMPVTVMNGSSAGTVTKSTKSITTTSSSILDTNTSRKRSLFVNLPSAITTVYFSFTGTALATDLPLPPGIGWLEAFDVIHTGAFSGIVPSGTGSLLVWEWV